MRTKGKGKIRPISHENISLNEQYNASEVGVCVSSEVDSSGYVVSVESAHQEPTADGLRVTSASGDSGFHIQRTFPDACTLNGGGHRFMSGEC